jgi:lipopolysaccharide biosynthesis protein
LRPSDDRIALLESQLASLTEEVARLRAQIKELQGSLIDREGLLGLADEAFVMRIHQADDLHQELTQRQKIIDTILQSRLWRAAVSIHRNTDVHNRVEELMNAGRQQSRREHVGIRYVHQVSDRLDADKLDVKAIAFYVPALRSIQPTGDAAGWPNVTTALPRYFGQYQPRVPGGLGCYDIDNPETLRKQIELARQYGIHGFCFYHYPSRGQHALEPAIQHLVENPDLQFKFCLCWITEQPDILEESLEAATPILLDSRYIRVSGKPAVIVFQPERLRDVVQIAERWKTRYLISASPNRAIDPHSIGFDAAVEYPDIRTGLADVTAGHALLDREYTGHIYSYAELANSFIKTGDSDAVTLPAVVPGWDEEAACHGGGDCAGGANPTLYANWLKKSCERAMRKPDGERLVFINAWNAWLDGAYLEPDKQWGYAYLHATANVLRDYHRDPVTAKLIDEINSAFKPANDAAIIFHCHYEDLIPQIFDQYISRIQDADLFVTVRNDVSKEVVEDIRCRFPRVFFVCEENRGRDIRPFLIALRRVSAFGYAIACKVHTKKTPQMTGGGEQWRENLFGPLLGSTDSVAKAREIFSREPAAGVLAPRGSVMNLQDRLVHVRNTFWLNRLLYRIQRTDLVGKYAFSFPAGSMYWFRVAALSGLADLILQHDEFERELGQADGALHHAVERLIGLYAETRGYKMTEISLNDVGTSDADPGVAPDFMAQSDFSDESEPVVQLRRQLEGKERDLAEVKWLLTEVTQSMSWRITTPLRIFASLFRSAHGVARSEKAKE